ncbi:hypothetical protein [Paraburkholderia caribensis]|uniref:hypothetical protein n=1 Tax=Paraburkholderia caribensis TaxID=75105 RepID=UPI001D075149|nr:hypothetical protein [Paraburkholderia caribensis]
MSAKTPPAEWDCHALEVARGIASIDRARLPGSTTQFVAILQTAIVQSMMMAADEARGNGRVCEAGRRNRPLDGGSHAQQGSVAGGNGRSEVPQC